MSIFNMFILLIVTMSLSAAPTANGNVRFIQLASELRLPLPENWVAPTDSTNYPFRIWHQSLSAELLIFRSEIKPEELITSDENLEQAVQSIVDDVILTLPEAKLLTSTGFYEGVRCGFVLEFLSVDSLAKTTLRHRLEGIIYRRPEGGQYLFTLWGKAPENQFGLITNDLQLMQKELRFYGKHTKEVYSERESYNWPLYTGLAIALAILLALRRIPSKKTDIISTGKDRFWRCSCGRPNPVNVVACRSCSARRTEKTQVVRSSSSTNTPPADSG